MKAARQRISRAALGVLVAVGICYAVDELNGAEEGLVAQWRFDDGEGDTVRDVSGNGHEAGIGGRRSGSMAESGRRCTSTARRAPVS